MERGTVILGTLIVRRAELKDVEIVADFNMRMAKETEGKELIKNVVVAGVKAVIEDPRKGFYLVAEKQDGNSRIVGQLLVTFEWSDWRNKYFWWIQSVYVDEKYRNQKVFSNLHRQIVEMAKSSKDVCGLRLYVERCNRNAKHVYEALGMKESSYDIHQLEL